MKYFRDRKMYKSFKISMTFVWLLSMNFFDLSSPGNDYFKILWHPSWYFYAWPWKLNAATNNSLLGCLKWWFKNRSCLQNQTPPPPRMSNHNDNGRICEHFISKNEHRKTIKGNEYSAFKKVPTNTQMLHFKLLTKQVTPYWLHGFIWFKM